MEPLSLQPGVSVLVTAPLHRMSPPPFPKQSAHLLKNKRNALTTPRPPARPPPKKNFADKQPVFSPTPLAFLVPFGTSQEGAGGGEATTQRQRALDPAPGIPVGDPVRLVP